MRLIQTRNLVTSGGMALAMAAVAVPLDGAQAGLKRMGSYMLAPPAPDLARIALPQRNPGRQARMEVQVAALSSPIALPVRMKRTPPFRRFAALSAQQPARAVDSFRRRLKRRVLAADVETVRRAYRGRKQKGGGRRKIGKARLLQILRDVKPRGLPMKLAAAVITVESAWRPQARGSSGEYGLMQLMPATARLYAPSYVKRLPDDHFRRVMMEPRMNMRVGTRVLHWCYKRAKGDVAATIGCYNRGPGRMWDWSGNHITKRYVSKVRRLLARAI